jgi:GxxExxY protein
MTMLIGNDLPHKIIGCDMEVHMKTEPGFQEVIYQRCLAIELERSQFASN